MTDLSSTSEAYNILRRDTAELPIYAPLSSPAVFWRPRHLKLSPMLRRVPYLFWLMDTLRPQTVVQIGLGDGLVYMALCQAAERIGVQAALMGLANPSDDAKNLLPDAFLKRHDAEYAEFSLLSAQPLAEAAKQHDGAVDLLVLNASLGEEDAKALTEHWLPALSDRAVIVVCDPENVLTKDALERDMLSPGDRPSLCGPMSPGYGQLDVFLHGPHQSERLLALTANGGEPALRMVARQVFGRLGQGLHDELQVEELQFQYQKERAHHQQIKQEVVSLQHTLAEANDSLTSTEAELAELQARLTATQAAHRSDIARLSAMGDRSEALNEARVKYRLVTQQLVKAREEAAAQVQKAGRSSQPRSANAEIAKLERRILEMEASTSWRLTRPLRNFKRLISRADKG